jgi:hypothetical protein
LGGEKTEGKGKTTEATVVLPDSETDRHYTAQALVRV